MPAEDRVGMMIKLADVEQGAVAADGTVTKSLTKADIEGLEKAKIKVKKIMEASGVTGPFVDGMVHGGHLGGTVPLTKEDVQTMHPVMVTPKPLGCRPLTDATFPRITDNVNYGSVVFASSKKDHPRKK